jgi:outer membrane lipoprotein-sorting protein
MKLLNKIFIIIVFLSQAAFPGDPDQTLKNVKDKFSTIKDFSAELKQGGKNQVFNGTIYYKKQNKFRIELKNMSIISDGSTIWNYNKKDNKVVD